MPVLEISDRGTVGLNGPVRNDQAVDPGTDTNFIDLLFNVGAPRDVHLGAGTYGFGKTVAYTTSRVGTVVYWTRCEGEEGLEDRFIASALGDGYDADGKRYTGRHWWGRVIDDENRVEPVTGNLARELGSLLFSRGFEGTETGTSILILDPIIDDGGSGDAIATLTDAILRNLWPKLLRNQTDRRVMRIRLQRDGSDQALPAIETHPQFGGYAACLLAVRSAQAPDLDERISWQFPLDTYEVRSQRPNKLLGHLALTRYPVTEAIVESYPSRSVALMRNRAELVVKYLERHQIGVDGFQWAAVFKPTEETDDSFADAEPPAHDDWIVASITDPRRKRDVNISLREIRKITDAFLSPNRTNVDSSKPVIPTGWVGDMLSDLIPHPGERQPAPSSKKGKSERRGGKRSAKPQARLVEVRYAPGSRLGWTRTSLDVEVDRAPVGGASVDVDLTVGIEGGSWPDDETIKRLGWLAEGNFATGPRQLKPKQTATYVYEARSELAIDVEVRVVDR
ncbi:hypothetical protein [Gordonia paraffinivorans]|uniref:hypothetical protein n=1 Tax=Gordonia paraffinivorans TaxID=175628 RepID=UPI001C92CDE5|nr:hypothetical protein [Gordonia paraffinivorans]